MLVSLLKPEIKEWLMKSIHSELFASNFYKHLANQMQRAGFFGAQKYFEHESADELTHYTKLRDYINDMGDVATIPIIEAFDYPVTTIGEALNKAYNTELELMRQYQDFYEESEDDYSDCITSTFIQDFLMIQKSSVGEYGDLISRYQRCGMNEAAVLEFDDFLGDKVA